MSGDNSEEKTEKPTAKKLRKAREKGTVVTSKETISSILTASVLAYLFARKGQIGTALTEFYLLDPDPALPFTLQLSARLSMALTTMVRIVAPILGLVLTLVILTSLLISGPVFTFHPLIPNPSKLNPVSGFKKIFGRKALMTFLMHLIRISALLAVLVVTYAFNLTIFVPTPPCGLPCQMATLWSLLLLLLTILVGLLLAFAVFDYMVQKAEFTREQRMSKTELKREYKEDDGDPLLKSQMRSDQRDMLSSPTGVSQATLIVHSGQKTAIAIRWVEGETPAPIIVAKATGAGGVSAMLRSKRIPSAEDSKLISMVGKKPIGDYIYEEEHVIHLAPLLNRVD